MSGIINDLLGCFTNQNAWIGAAVATGAAFVAITFVPYFRGVDPMKGSLLAGSATFIACIAGVVKKDVF